MNWSPAQYTKFENERNRPTYDLLAQIPTQSVARAADIGCGPGNSTQLLQEHFTSASIIGIDSSPEMIDAARKRLPDIKFTVTDITTWDDPKPFDLIFANAVLQWLPDHASLLPNLLAKLAPGGSLAVQIPDNFGEPSHQLMRQTAAQDPWAGKLASARQAKEGRHNANWYYRLLREHGTQVNLWRTTYYHPLPGGPRAIVEWVRGTGLRPFLELLDPAEELAFLASYESLLTDAYPVNPDGTVLLPFPRLFFVATR